MEALDVGLVIVGGLTLTLGLTTSLFRSRRWLPSEPMVAVALGVVVGPVGLALFDPGDWSAPLRVLEEVARVTIAVAVMSVALRLPRRYFSRNARAMAALLGLAMPLMWAASGILCWLTLGLPFGLALLVGAVVTPTDPVLAGTIVTGRAADRCIPARLRHAISAESGANDGGAYPFVLFATILLAAPLGEALRRLAWEILLWKVGGAVAIGAALGWAAGRLQRWADRHHYFGETSVLSVTLSLTLVVLGVVHLIGSDGVLAVFAAGLLFNDQAEKHEEAAQQKVQEVMNRLLSVPVFVLFGALLPWAAWADRGWAPLLLLAALVLALRRLPAVFAIAPLVRPFERRRDVWFAGWFGPVGIAAIFYATLASRETGDSVVWQVGSFVVLASVVAHGATATWFTQRYGAQRGAATDA